MRKLLVCLCGGVLAIALVPTISVGGNGSPYDFVTGAGWRGDLTTPTTPLHSFDVSAHVGPNGVFGTYNSHSRTQPYLDFDADVTCVYVAGDHAVVGGVVRKGGGAGQLGTGVAVGFIDNPSPTPDSVTLTGALIPLPVDCADLAGDLFAIGTLPVLRGNVNVHDAP